MALLGGGTRRRPREALRSATVAPLRPSGPARAMGPWPTWPPPKVYLPLVVHDLRDAMGGRQYR